MERAIESKETELRPLTDAELDAVAGGKIPSSLLLKVIWPSTDYGTGTCNTDGTYTP
jgi:hypothetical protein